MPQVKDNTLTTLKSFTNNIRVATYRIPVRKYSLKIQTPAHFP